LVLLCDIGFEFASACLTLRNIFKSVRCNAGVNTNFNLIYANSNWRSIVSENAKSACLRYFAFLKTEKQKYAFFIKLTFV
jgi:hypothetical protein